MDDRFVERLKTVTNAALQARRSGSYRHPAHPNGVTIYDVTLFGEPAGADFAAERMRDWKQALLDTAEAGVSELTFNTYSWGSRARQGFIDEIMQQLPGIIGVSEGKAVKMRWS